MTFNGTSKIIAGTLPTALSGTVSLEASGGSITTERGSKIINDGGVGEGPALSVTSPGACTLAGAVRSKSGLGGLGSDTEISCNSLTLEPSFLLDARNGGGTGGSLNATIAGACSLAGDAKVTSVAGKDAGVAIPGNGGAIVIGCGAEVLQSKTSALDASAAGGNETDGYSTAGSVTVSSVANGVTLGGKLLANSPKGGGGAIGVAGIGVTTTTDSRIEAKGPGAMVEVASRDDGGGVVGDVSIGKLVGAAGGDLTVEGCNVTIESTAELTSSGPTGGSTTVTAHKGLVVNGKISALSAMTGIPEGNNYLTYRDSVSVADPKKIQPITTPEQDGTLSACP